MDGRGERDRYQDRNGEGGEDLLMSVLDVGECGWEEKFDACILTDNENGEK